MPQENELLAGALRYAALGLAVIPVMGKRPWFENWPAVATSETATIERWWSSTPTANIGIATGQRSNVFVLDIDAKSGGLETYEQMKSEHGQFPNTWQQTTGGGGIHLFFRYPNFRVSNCAGLLPGVDVRGDGGQVVAPPSVHPDTHKRYEWDGIAEIEQTPLAEAPVWLLELLQGKNAPPPERKDPTQVPDKLPQGTRHPTLVSLAGMMRRLGLSPDEIAPTLQAVNARRCEPPYDAPHVTQIAQSMEKYRPADKSLYATATKLWRMAAKAEGDRAREMDRLKVNAADGLAVYRSNTPPPSEVIGGMLANGLTILAGKSKQGKSWAGLQMALAVATGQQFLGWADVTRPGGVIYFSLEMGESRNAARMRKLCTAEDISFQNIDFVWESLPMLSGGIEQLHAMLDKKQANLVIIDTFLAFVKAQSESGDVMRTQYREIDALKKVADKHETAILLIHHTRKTGKWDSDDAGVDLVAGSRGITAACDAVWVLRKSAEQFVLDITGRDLEEQSLALRFEKEPFGWKILGHSEAIRDKTLEKEVLQVMADLGTSAQRAGKVAGNLHISTPKAEEVLMRLARDGMVAKTVGGLYYVRSEH